MKIIKWTILLLIVASSLSEKCHASLSHKEKEGNIGCTIQPQDTPIEQLTDTLRELRLISPGELLENNTHNNYDKKTFSRLLIHLIHSQAESSATYRKLPLQRKSLPQLFPSGTYYIYKLEKILI